MRVQSAASSVEPIAENDQREQSTDNARQENPEKSLKKSAKLQKKFDEVVPLLLSEQAFPDAANYDANHRQKDQGSDNDQRNISSGKAEVKRIIEAGARFDDACVGGR